VGPFDQEKVPPDKDGVALSVVDDPEQIVTPFAKTVGCGFTTTFSVEVVAHDPDKGVNV
jgi:hypothetical protein